MRLRRSVAAIAALLWFASLCLPVVRQTELPGYLILAMGWYGVAAGEIGWLANITFWVAIARLTDPGVFKVKSSFGAAVLTVTVAATTLGWNKAFGLDDEQKIVGLSFGIGYYLWVSALLLVSVSLFARTFVYARH